MILFPTSTYYGRRMPKEKFYAHLEVSPAVRRSFVEDVEQFVWLNKLSATTLNVESGKKVKEIALFEVTLKHEEYNAGIFETIDRNVPVFVVYLLRFCGQVRLHINYKEPQPNKLGTFRIVETFESEWQSDEQAELKIEGLNLDAVYDGFIRQVAGSRLQESSNESLTEDIEQSQQRAKILRQIEQLQKRKRREVQFNKQLEIAAEIKKLKELL